MKRVFSEGRRGCFGIVPEWETGVGGWEGMKKEGMEAIEDCVFL